MGRVDLVVVHPGLDQVVHRDRLGRDDLDRRLDDRDPVALDAPHDRHPSPADLRVQERVADVERQLVSQLGGALGVAEDQEIHRYEPIGGSVAEARVGWKR